MTPRPITAQNPWWTEITRLRKRIDSLSILFLLWLGWRAFRLKAVSCCDTEKQAVFSNKEEYRYDWY